MLNGLEIVDITSLLLKWYDTNMQNYPWRENQNPYHIWLSEVMLQQTQVNTVIPYYYKWLKNFPNISMVADADLEDLLKKWEGLGYYARVRNFHSSCKIVKTKFNLSIPNRYDDLIALPGIGPYIAGAILSIAFNLPFAAIDGNAKRVFSRFYEIDLSRGKGNNSLYTAFSIHIPNARPGDFNQAIMDLGRIICTSQKPTCDLCPLQMDCKAYANSSVNTFPIKMKKREKPHYHIAVGVIKYKGKLLISKRTENGLLGGLWEFPGGKIIAGESAEECVMREIKEELGVLVIPQLFIKQIHHKYSHFSITMDAYFCDYLGGTPQSLGCADWRWVDKGAIYQLPFPKANHKLFRALEERWNLC